MNETSENLDARAENGVAVRSSALLGACVGMTIGALIGNVLVALMDTSSHGWVGCLFAQIATTWTIYWCARRK